MNIYDFENIVWNAHDSNFTQQKCHFLSTIPMHTYENLTHMNYLLCLVKYRLYSTDCQSVQSTSDNFSNNLCPRHLQTSNLDLGFASVKIACLQVARTQIIGSLSSVFVQIVSINHIFLCHLLIVYEIISKLLHV